MNRKQMIARQQELLDLAKSEKRALTEDEQREFDGLQRSIEAMDAAANPGSGASGEPGNEPTPAPDNRGADGLVGHVGSIGPTGPSGIPDDDARQRFIQEERQRISTITQMCRNFGMDPKEYVDNGTSVDDVRAAVIEHLQRNNAPIHTGVHVEEVGEQRFQRDMSDALMLRAGLHVENPSEEASRLVGMSLRQILIEAETLRGKGAGLNRASNEELFQRAFFNPESAFPAILDQTIEKSYREGHRTAPVTFDRFTKKGTLTDFKTHDNNYLAGPVGEFLEVPENGELKHDVFTDAKLPTRKLRTYGRQFTLSRKAFIDDDIGLVTRVPAKYAASARKTINKQVFQILLGNAAIYDGVPLFDTAHKNLLAEGTGVTQDAMQTMIMALATQKDQFGQAIIINPSKIVVPSGLKFDMYTLFNSQYIETKDNTQAVNPLYQYRNELEVVEDPTINALCGGMGQIMPWFLFGSASDTDGIEVDYLNGQEIPTIRRSEVIGQLGFVWDIYLDWGISVMDYRGIVKNPGVAVKTKLNLA